MQSKTLSPTGDARNPSESDAASRTGEAFPESLEQNIVTLVASSDRYCETVIERVPLTLYGSSVARTIAKEAYQWVMKRKTAPKDHLPDLLEDKMTDANKGDPADRALFSEHRCPQKRRLRGGIRRCSTGRIYPS